MTGRPQEEWPIGMASTLSAGEENLASCEDQSVSLQYMRAV